MFENVFRESEELFNNFLTHGEEMDVPTKYFLNQIEGIVVHVKIEISELDRNSETFTSDMREIRREIKTLSDIANLRISLPYRARITAETMSSMLSTMLNLKLQTF